MNKISMLSLLAELGLSLKKCSQRTFIAPMLATLTKDYFSDKRWLYEHKFDGERCIAIKKKGKVSLKSRNRNSMNKQYPELVNALTQQKADNFIIDGEIISKNKRGVSDFELLQGRINLSQPSTSNKKIPIIYCVFDVMHCNGHDTRTLPLIERKKILKKLLSFNKLISYTPHILRNGLTYFKKACNLRWEGVIAKRIDSTYTSKRSRDWLKFKCIMQQELVIAGYTSPQGSRTHFGALLVGYYNKKGDLVYAGKVGTGFDEKTLSMLGKKLERLQRASCPFAYYEGPTRNVYWVKPVLVAEFQFAQWTTAGRLRVGRYKGLRDDKNAKDVVKETPRAIGPDFRKHR